MDLFEYRDGMLFCEEVDVNLVAREVGTPVFIYSAGTILDHFNKITRAWGTIRHMVCYAVKANSNIAILRLLSENGAGMEVVSHGELFRCLRAGADPRKIVFTGTGKTAAEIEYALQNDIFLFVVESLPELSRLNEIAGRLKRVAQFAMRVNPDVDPHTHSHITTGKAINKFGVDPDSAVEAYRGSKEMAHVSAVGIHMHIGSQIVSSEPYVLAVKKLLSVIEKVREFGIGLKYFDLGGGMGVIYREEDPRTAEQLIGDIIPLVENLNMTIIMEPGRFIVGNAGVLVTEVQYVKDRLAKKFVVVDAGMNDLIRPALYGAYHRIVPTRDAGPDVMEADVVGPVCESADSFAESRPFPAVKQGDYLAIMTAGAYGSSMSSEYNSRLKCAEVLVRGEEFFVIRERAGLEHLVENERIPEFLSEPLPARREGRDRMSRNVEFAKYTGAGNDFIIIDNRSGSFRAENKEAIRDMCSRRTSIGADGLILLERSDKADIRMRFFNSDGGEAEMCGNGARCLIDFARRRGFESPTITLETMERVLTAHLDGENISLEMGAVKDTELNIDIEIDGKTYRVHHANTGVPHAVMFVEDVNEVDVVGLGRKTRFHKRFQPKGANANFVHVTGESSISARIYERGVEDETLASGTGCTACAVISNLVKNVKPPVRVLTRGGETLTINFKRKGDQVSDLTMSGPTRLVYEGVYYP